MVFGEDDLLPLSALQHLLFCERQCALIHVEGLWTENRLTAEGRHLHERADSGEAETRGPVRTVRSLPLRSLRLGLAGRADVVEFHDDSAGELAQVVPIEYKRGRPKLNDSDRVQLCAQALCLEEMVGIRIPTGALFYASLRRRTDVVFDTALRETTEQAVARLHAMIRAEITPKVRMEPKCTSCSLIDVCMPDVTGSSRSAAAFAAAALARSLAGDDDGLQA